MSAPLRSHSTTKRPQRGLQSETVQRVTCGRKDSERPLNRNDLNPDASPQAACGARLRSLREARGWTQEDLAERAEYSSVHVSAVENGRKPPVLA